MEISSGEQVSRQGRETYEFEYKLGERWSLLGEYDQFDSYNAGVKWRVYTEESKPLEKEIIHCSCGSGLGERCLAMASSRLQRSHDLFAASHLSVAAGSVGPGCSTTAPPDRN